MIFSWRQLRCEFAPRGGQLQFHECAAVTIRGALGFALAEAPLLYQEFFAPKRMEGPSGFRTPPRLFVLRTRHLNAQCIHSDQPFHFSIHVFGSGDLGPLQAVLRRMAEAGLSENRVPLRLLAVEQQECSISLDSDRNASHGVTVEFMTPTSLKPLPASTAQIPFPILFARARDRVSSLLTFYGPATPNQDFRALGDLAALIKSEEASLLHVAYDRRSARTGQSHSLAGLTGWARYSCDEPDVLPRLLPWLRAAQFCGLGRHTVWGMGEIAVRSNP